MSDFVVENAVLARDEVEVLKSLAATPGLSHLALFRPEKRMDVLESFGLCPTVAELFSLWAQDPEGVAPEWLNVRALAHATVTEVVDEDGNPPYVGFSILPTLSGLNAQLVWSMLAETSEHWRVFRQHHTGPPELAKAISVAPEVPPRPVMREVELDDTVVQVVELSGTPEPPFPAESKACWPAQMVLHASKVLDVYSLRFLSMGPKVVSSTSPQGVWPMPAKLRAREGYCYLKLFAPWAQPVISGVLGYFPSVGAVIEVYLAALVYGFADRAPVALEGSDPFHVVDLKKGDWRKNLVLLAGAVLGRLDMEVGGFTKKLVAAWGGPAVSGKRYPLECSSVNDGSHGSSAVDSSSRSADTAASLALRSGVTQVLALLPDSAVSGDDLLTHLDGLQLAKGGVYRCCARHPSLLGFPRGCRVSFPRLTMDCDAAPGLVRVYGGFEFKVWEVPAHDAQLSCVQLSVGLELCWQEEFGNFHSEAYYHVVSGGVRPTGLIFRAHSRFRKRNGGRWRDVGAVQLHDDLDSLRLESRYRVSDLRELRWWPRARHAPVSVDVINKEGGFSTDGSRLSDYSVRPCSLRVGGFWHDLEVNGSWPVVIGSGWSVTCLSENRVSMTVSCVRHDDEIDEEMEELKGYTLL